jgi:multidrug efflux system outer membrane protein
MRCRLLLVGCLVLSACAGPRRDPPRLATVIAPSDWRAGGAASDSRFVGWSAFGDPVLPRLVDTALANNVDVALAAARVAEARAQFRGARAQQLLSVGAVADGGRQRDVNPGFGIPEEQGASQGAVQATFDLDLFGKLSNASKAARAGLLASEAARDNVRLAVASATASGYVTLRALDARLEVLRDTLEARRAELKIARRLTAAGYSSRLEFAQAQAEFDATEQLIPPTELAISRQEDGLSVLIGDNPRGIERGTSFDALVVPTVPVSLPAALLRRRPDILEAEQQLVTADRELDSTRAAFLPDVQLAASGGFVGSTLVKASPVAVWSLGGSILAPLFESGRLQAQQDSATARRDQAALQYRKTALAAFREIEDDLATVKHDDEQERSLSSEKDDLAHALVLATNRYRAGYSPYLTQLDAQRSLLSVQLALVQSRADRLNAAVSLFQAAGGGWRGPQGVESARIDAKHSQRRLPD